MTGPWPDLKWWNSKTYHNLTHELAQLEYNTTVLPTLGHRYGALKATPFDTVKCVILGQDPYPTKGHAHGLAFSVFPSVSPFPRSLRNIFREYHDDLGYKLPTSGCLYPWAVRGVLLLNTCLSVEEGKAGSHRNKGWERLAIEIIHKVSEESPKPVSFLLWGKDAQEYEGLVNTERHQVIKAPHPSPFSASKGFFGHRPFTRVNEFIPEPIDWRLP